MYLLYAVRPSLLVGLSPYLRLLGRRRAVALPFSSPRRGAHAARSWRPTDPPLHMPGGSTSRLLMPAGPVLLLAVTLPGMGDLMDNASSSFSFFSVRTICGHPTEDQTDTLKNSQQNEEEEEAHRSRIESSQGQSFQRTECSKFTHECAVTRFLPNTSTPTAHQQPNRLTPTFAPSALVAGSWTVFFRLLAISSFLLCLLLTQLSKLLYNCKTE
jgi:hypothetical protein